MSVIGNSISRDISVHEMCHIRDQASGDDDGAVIYFVGDDHHATQENNIRSMLPPTEWFKPTRAEAMAVSNVRAPTT